MNSLVRPRDCPFFVSTAVTATGPSIFLSIFQRHVWYYSTRTQHNQVQLSDFQTVLSSFIIYGCRFLRRLVLIPFPTKNQPCVVVGTSKLEPTRRLLGLAGRFFITLFSYTLITYHLARRLHDQLDYSWDHVVQRRRVM
jgi:hypothetical protein